MGKEMTGQGKKWLPPQQNFGDYQKYMQDRNKCAKTAPRKVALQCPSTTSATTRSTCRTEANAQRQHHGRWLFNVPAELRRPPEVHAGQKQMRKDSTKEGGSSMSQQNFGDHQKYMQDRNKCAKTAPRKVALQCPSRTSAATRSTCRTEANAQRQHHGRWLFNVPAELRRPPEVHAGQKQMRKDSTMEGGSSRSQQNFGDYQKYMQGSNKCAKTAPWKVALQGPSRTSATTRSTCRTETNAQRQHQGRWLFNVPAELRRLPEVHAGQKQTRKEGRRLLKENFGKCLKFWTHSCAFAQGAEK